MKIEKIVVHLECTLPEKKTITLTYPRSLIAGNMRKTESFWKRSAIKRAEEYLEKKVTVVRCTCYKVKVDKL